MLGHEIIIKPNKILLQFNFIILLTGCPLVLYKYLQGFLNFFKVFESTRFWVYFYFKIKLKVKTVLNSITTFEKLL